MNIEVFPLLRRGLGRNLEIMFFLLELQHIDRNWIIDYVRQVTLGEDKGNGPLRLNVNDLRPPFLDIQEG